MSSQPLIRWSGIALVLGGLVQIVIGFLHPDENAPGSLLNPMFATVHLIAAVGFMATAFGLIGLYLRQVEAGGKLNIIAFLIAFVGTVLTVGFVIDEAFFLVDLAQRNPAVQTLNDFAPNATPAVQGYLPVLLGGLMVYLLGWILTGIAAFRAGVFPRWIGVLIGIGVVLTFGSLAGAHIVRVIGGVVFGAGLIGAGAALFGRQTESSAAMQAQLAK